MNVSLYTKNQYTALGQKDNPRGQGGVFADTSWTKEQKTVSDGSSLTQKMRDMIRGLEQTKKVNRNPYSATLSNKVNGFLDLSHTVESEKDELLEKTVDYNYKDVASKIQQAKNSVSAGRAVLAAGRKVLEIRRKITIHDGDPEELQISLTHAKRMEMAARKKKHNIELEELVVRTQKRDENTERLKDSAADMENAMISFAEEDVSEQEDAIFDDRMNLMRTAQEEATESTPQEVEDLMWELNEMISEFGEEELAKLEETMENLENLEVVDPHMSEEDLEDLKRKHRAAENKAIMKADMDYLKDLIKHQTEKAGMVEKPLGVIPAAQNIGVTFAAVSVSADISMPGAAAVDCGMVDVQV